MINKQNIIWALEELASRQEQERLWLSDGSSGEVSSFEEIICDLFDGGFTQELNSGAIEETFSAEFSDKIKQLRKLAGRIPANSRPEDIINHQDMETIRGLSKALLTIMNIQGHNTSFSEKVDL